MGNSSGSCLGSEDAAGGDEGGSGKSDTRQPCQRYGPPAVGNQSYAVKIRIYNLQQAFKRGRKHITTSLGFGFFHSAVEVFGREWQFGGNQNAAPEDSGIFFLPPEMVMPPHQVYEVLTIGYLPLSATNERIEAEVMSVLLPKWTALSYHILSHNCNHFIEAFVEMLNQLYGLTMKVPSYINRAARFGDVFVPDTILQQMMRQTPQAPPSVPSAPLQSRSSATANKDGCNTSPTSKLGHNPTVTRADGRHFTIGGVELKRFQGWSGSSVGVGGGGPAHATNGECRCGNPYCRNNPNGFNFYGQKSNRNPNGGVGTDEVDAELPPIPSDSEMATMPVKRLKTIMWLNGISWEGCVEKEDLMEAVRKCRLETDNVK